MRRIILSAAAFITVAPALAQQESKLLEETRKTVMTLPPKLVATLQAEIQKGGPAAAIGVCRTLAPQAVGEMSNRTGWRITRVSLKPRNPLLGTPDAWEREQLQDFDRRAAAGDNPAALEKGEIVTEGDARYFRYVKALPVQPLCLSCHGPADRITDDVRQRLDADYPHDRATGYSEGQIRGAISVKRPL